MVLQRIKVDYLTYNTEKLNFSIKNQTNPKQEVKYLLGVVSPHEELSPKESASLIINHVKDGILLAQKYNLPC